MKLQKSLKGQLKHLLIHFGVEFEDPYWDCYSPHDETIDNVMTFLEEDQKVSLRPIKHHDVKSSDISICEK